MTERITPQAAMARLAQSGERYVTLLKNRRLELEYYKPVGTDPQKPHTRDEMYFVLSGHGIFVCDGKRSEFEPGEVMYVPAGVPHRFERFSEDFATWAIFLD